MNNQILETEYILPLTTLNNGLISGKWTNPNYLLLQDNLTAESSPSQGATCDVMVGNFNFNIPSDAVITGIQFKIRGYVGAITVPAASITFNAVNNLSGEIVYYPYTASFDGFSQDFAEYVFGSPNYLFDHDWTVDEINNFKLQLIGAGDIFIDDVQGQVFYYVPGTPTPPTPSSQFCLTCESPIQGTEYLLALELTDTDTKAYVYNFDYADGTPIQISDLGDCGGVIEVVLDQGKTAVNGNNFMENAAIVDINRLPSGLVELDFGTLNNRGLMFKTPYAHDVNLVSPHSVNASLIISNSAPYENKKLRTCQKGVVFSAPITVQDEGVDAVTAMETLNFIGPNVQAEVDPDDSTKANVTILAQATNVEPTVESTSQGTTEAATSLTVAHTITDANYLRVWVSTDNQTISGVTYNGVTMVAIAEKANVPQNLKVALYGLINPAVGTHNIVITMGASSHISGGGVSFTDVDTGNPTDGVSAGAIGSSTAPSDTVTTTIDNTVLMDVVGTIINTTAFAQGPLWTVNSQVNAASRPGASSTRKVLVPATVIDTYTISPTGAWAILIAGVRGATAPSVAGQASVQFENEGSNLGTPGTVTEVDFTGSGVTATRTGDKVTVNVPGGGSSISLETDGTPNADQAVLNLISGTNITLTPDGSGGVTIDASGGGSGSSISVAITQTAHGFSVGDVIKSSGTANQFALAQADVAVNAEVVGIVTAVAGVNDFTYDKDIMGYTGAGIPTGTPGEAIFLDPTTPGAMTITEPITAGLISKPLGILIASGAKMNFTADYRGQEQQSIPVGLAQYNSGQSSYSSGSGPGTLTIPHGLLQAPSLVKITALAKNTTVVECLAQSFGTAIDVATQSSTVSESNLTAGTSGVAQDSTNIINLGITPGGGELFLASVSTIDGTDIILTFSVVSGDGTCLIQWEAYA